LYQKESAAFFEHRELAHWQAEQFDKCIDDLPEHHIVVLIDYSMNYSHNHSTAVQGKGGNSSSVLVLVRGFVIVVLFLLIYFVCLALVPFYINRRALVSPSEYTGPCGGVQKTSAGW
jgi:hypothetical protein